MATYATRDFVTWSKCFYSYSPWCETREKCPVRGKWNPRSLLEVPGNISFSTYSFGIRSASENMWYVNKGWSLFLCHRNVWVLFIIVLYPEKEFHKCCRWHPWPVLWPPTAIWIRRISSRVQLLVSWRLCGQRKAVAWDNLSSSCIQDQIPREFFLAQRESWMCKHQ